MRELAAVGGLGGWRTRLSELGRRTSQPMRIEHNKQNGARSCHRYVPAASEPSPDRWPIPGAPQYETPFELKAEQQR